MPNYGIHYEQRRSWVKILGDALKKFFFGLLSDAGGCFGMLKFFRVLSTKNHKKIHLIYIYCKNRLN